MGQLRLSLCLTREEFLAVFAVQWVAMMYRCYGAEDLSEEEFDETFLSVGSALRWGIRKLALEGGYRFSAIEVSENGNLESTRGEIEPGNQAFLRAMTLGAPLNYLSACSAAITFIETRGVRLSTEPLRQAVDEIGKSLEESMANLDPAELQLAAEGRRFLLESALETAGERSGRSGGRNVRNGN